MTEEVGLIVRAKMVPDRRGMERIAKETTQATKKATANVERSIKGIMPKSLGGLFSGGMKGLGGDFLGRIGGFANRMGAGSGVGNAAVAGAVGGIMASAMNGVMGLLKKGLSVLVESSGSLRNVLKLLNMGFLQIIRPFADVLAIMLRPIAMFFRIIGREVMKRVREKRKELKAQGYSGIALGGALMAELPSIYLDVLMEQLGKIDWGTFFSKILSVLWENLTVRLPAFLGKVFEILNGLGEWIWENIILAIGNLATTELANFGKWLWTGITDAIGDLTGALGDFGNWVYKVLTGAITLPQALFDIGGWFYDMFVKVYNGFADFANMFSLFTGITVQKMLSAAEKEAWSDSGREAQKRSFYAYHPELAPAGYQQAAGGATMSTDGLIYAHAGEVVKDRGDILGTIRDTVRSEMGGAGFSGNITVNINGNVSSNVQLERAIMDGIDRYYNTRVVSRR